MSPELASVVTSLSRLRAEMREDRSAMTRRSNDLQDAEHRLEQAPRDAAALALLAWALHGWYTALESILERVARQLDQEVATGERWHRELLTQAATDIPGLRPAVISRESKRDLEELLAMRHFLRHAYGADLDESRLAAQAVRLRRVGPVIESAVCEFDRFIEQTIEAAGQSTT